MKGILLILVLLPLSLKVQTPDSVKAYTLDSISAWARDVNTALLDAPLAIYKSTDTGLAVYRVYGRPQFTHTDTFSVTVGDSIGLYEPTRNGNFRLVKTYPIIPDSILAQATLEGWSTWNQPPMAPVEDSTLYFSVLRILRSREAKQIVSQGWWKLVINYPQCCHCVTPEGYSTDAGLMYKYNPPPCSTYIWTRLEEK